RLSRVLYPQSPLSHPTNRAPPGPTLFPYTTLFRSLPGVVLDDQMLFHIEVDLLPARQLQDLTRVGLGAEAEPLRHTALLGRFHVGLDQVQVPAPLPEIGRAHV